MPPRVNIYQAYAWVLFRTTEAVSAIYTHRDLAAAGIHGTRERHASRVELRNALRLGEIEAVGAKLGGPVEPVPSYAWEKSEYHPNGCHEVYLSSSSLLARWKPLSQAGSALYEHEMPAVESWHTELLQEDPHASIKFACRDIQAKWSRAYPAKKPPSETTVKGWIRKWRAKSQAAH